MPESDQDLQELELKLKNVISLRPTLRYIDVKKRGFYYRFYPPEECSPLGGGPVVLEQDVLALRLPFCHTVWI